MLASAGQSKQRRVRVLVGDHQPMFREQVALTLKAWPEFEVVGVVDADAILPSLLQLKPDVAVLDPTSLDTETQDEVFALARGETRLLFLSSEADDKSYVAIERGAIGCLTKAIAPQELCNAVAAAARGEAYIATAAVSAIAAALRLRNRTDRPYLSKRQLEVLRLVAEGHTNQQIAEELVVAEPTVKSHLRAINKALGVKNRTQAVLAGMRYRLIE
ncbi:MAG TPA: response regulator transcription factor [Solirubrobacteraceae bacterium]